MVGSSFVRFLCLATKSLIISQLEWWSGNSCRLTLFPQAPHSIRPNSHTCKCALSLSSFKTILQPFSSLSQWTVSPSTTPRRAKTGITWWSETSDRQEGHVVVLGRLSQICKHSSQNEWPQGVMTAFSKTPAQILQIKFWSTWVTNRLSPYPILESQLTPNCLPSLVEAYKTVTNFSGCWC